MTIELKSIADELITLRYEKNTPMEGQVSNNDLPDKIKYAFGTMLAVHRTTSTNATTAPALNLAEKLEESNYNDAMTTLIQSDEPNTHPIY